MVEDRSESTVDTSPPHSHWMVGTVWIKLADSAKFADLSGQLARALSRDLNGDVLLWFSGFPITGDRRTVLSDGQIRGEFMLIWNIKDKETGARVQQWIAQSPLPWVKEWSATLVPMDETTTHTWYISACPSEQPPLIELGLPWSASQECQPEDLYVVSPDEEIFRVNKERYSGGVPPEYLFEDIEFTLAETILNRGSEVASIPSIGLPIRGSFCYIVSLPQFTEVDRSQEESGS